MSFTSQESSIHNETFGKDASFKLSQLIGSMSISPSGRDVVLGSKEGLHIIDLDSPYSPPRFLPHRTPWEVADVQWSPFADRDYWVVSTSNQKALVWNLNLYGWRNSIQHVLHGHRRAITDINFSAHHPDKLATCAVDSFVHCWDLRATARPVISFSDWFSGATQVKWSRQDDHVVASSHDKFLHIWDDRNGAYPARTIEAHDTKIYGIDWNRFEPSKIVTCSLDKTIKFWDTNKAENVPDRVIETTFPVWRARHTPFGYGLMVMPQRGNGDLHLYDRRPVNEVLENGHVKPVHVFRGHKGQVKEFLWRAFGTVNDGVDHRDFQLVTWGTDRDLRLHVVSEDIFANVGYWKGISKPQRLRFTRRGARYKTFRDEPTEQDAAATMLPRTDSIPANNQFLRVRGRLSTNMGMSRIPVAQFKGWLQAGKVGRKTDMHGRGAGRPDMDPISWMKNVKIASEDTDSLADEITFVGDNFKKVDFETVDLSQRKATMSLQSPWGEPGNTSVYTRLDLRFPKGYPKDAQAVIIIQKTNSISSEVQKRLSSDIQKIAEAYKARSRGCIEAVVRYLLREQPLEQIISLVMRDSMTDSKILDTTNPIDDASDDSDDDQIGSLATNVQSNAKVNVPPLAKRCAALWAENGKLVCFFKLDDNEPASLVSTLGTGHLDDSESSKLFGGFGKFQVDSPSRKAKDAVQTANDSDSETSDRSSVFSSSTSSSESLIDFGERTRFGPWQRTTIDSLQRARSTDGSQKSTIIDSMKSGETTGRTIISIHDLTDIIPSSKQAAKDYQISGKMVDLCRINCDVASRYSLSVASTVWRLALFISENQVHEQIENVVLENPDLALLVKQVKIMSNSLPDHSHQGVNPTEPDPPIKNYIGKFYLLPSLMQFCEKIGDIQILALLSAAYLQSHEGVLYAALNSSDNIRHLIKAGAYNHHYRAQGPEYVNRHNIQHLPHNHRGSLHTQGLRFSVSGEKLTDHGDAGKSGATAFTIPSYLPTTRASSGAPSIVALDHGGFTSASHAPALSLAGSPENYRTGGKAEPSIAFPAATASLQALTKSRPPSPTSHPNPTDSFRFGRSSKSLRTSPEDSLVNDTRSRLKSSLSLANVSAYGEENSRQHTSRKGIHPILKVGLSDPTARNSKKKKLRTKIFRPPFSVCQNDIIPILQPLDVYQKCLSYMEQYLPLLESWQLWVQKAEMLTIHAHFKDMLNRIAPEGGTSVSASHNHGLEIRRCCPQCGQEMSPIEKNRVTISWHCTSRSCSSRNPKPSKRQHCTICEVVLGGLSVPCLQCGHLSCYSCAQVWFMRSRDNRKSSSNISNHTNRSDIDSSNNGTCPTGCGCACPFLTTIDVPEPNNMQGEFKSELAGTPTTPRSESFHEIQSHTSPVQERRTHRGQSIGNTNVGADSALNALLALNSQSRHRSISSTVITPRNPEVETGSTTSNTRNRENSINADDELLPWANDKNPTLGRGLGGGFSRGLSNKGSSSTIRQSSRKE